MKLKLLATLILGLTFVVSAQTHTAYAESAPVYTSFFNGYAVSGYDTVSYFVDGKALKGDKRFKADYLGKMWLFSSESHRDLFEAAPEKYAPQYGGYCAFAVAKNDLVSADPEAWMIVDGKLFLNYDKDIQKKWEGDRDSYIAKADKNWPTILK